MIEPHWKRIAGIHQKENGEIAAVWLALDPDNDVVHLYDTCQFRGDDRNPIIVSEGLNARGRKIPVAHDSKELAEMLRDRGCCMLEDPTKGSAAMIEVISGDIAARMRTGRFKVSERLADWKDEYKSFFREDAKVPISSHPLMIATRHAMAELDYAKAERSRNHSKPMYPTVAMI